MKRMVAARTCVTHCHEQFPRALLLSLMSNLRSSLSSPDSRPAPRIIGSSA